MTYCLRVRILPWPAWLMVVRHHPAKQKVTDSIPGQGTCLGCGFGSWLGCIREAAN